MYREFKVPIVLQTIKRTKYTSLILQEQIVTHIDYIVIYKFVDNKFRGKYLGKVEDTKSEIEKAVGFKLSKLGGKVLSTEYMRYKSSMTTIENGVSYKINYPEKIVLQLTKKNTKIFLDLFFAVNRDRVVEELLTLTKK